MDFSPAARGRCAESCVAEVPLAFSTASYTALLNLNRFGPCRVTHSLSISFSKWESSSNCVGSVSKILWVSLTECLFLS
jgi:hypothetical protein